MATRRAEQYDGPEAALTEAIIGAAIEVHRALGPGLLERTYERCLVHELGLRRMRCRQQVWLPISYKDIELEDGYRMDLLVEDRVVVELKCVDQVLPIHHSQLLTYLQLSGIRVGLLINFQVKYLISGISRKALTRSPSPSSA